ncbi:phage tail assembly chaperone [Pseudomonas xanthosomatis]|uniref:phage tail assembly chaperone n=1 Tax=Pseudomonas xanthosomatis TaxID=2842356 RepID=UPI001C3E254D|nr:phage tail assembly chaperone [Pseudomonas xanthosomatis]QXH45764.1 phage tail assembly chaperone [Pseudomonas xanthosomatis]
MPFVQRNEQGQITGQYANRQPGYAEEWLPGESEELTFVSPQQRADEERGWRNTQFTGLIWLRDRHRDQLEIGATTTLSSEQFAELLVHMQALRDWPQSEAFPDAAKRPQAPQFLEQLGGDQ